MRYPKPGDKVYSRDGGYPFLVTDVRLVKDFPDDPEATDDIVCVKKHPSYPGYDRMEPWEKSRGAMWSVDRIRLPGKQLSLL